MPEEEGKDDMMFGKKQGFKKAVFKESRDLLGGNPGRGWYHLYYHMAEKEPDYKEMEDSLTEGEALTLPVINIGYFRHGSISEDGLRHICGILDFYVRHGKELVLRFSYDTQGNGSEREPWAREIILGHMAQLGEMIQPYKKKILVHQGLFIGSWGEMHGSRYLTQGSMKVLLSNFRKAVGEDLPLALRRPSQLRMVWGTDKNICLYDDGMFGSENDLGTYGTVPRETAKEEESWNREDELDWQDTHIDGKPNGGETVAAPDPVGFVRASQDMERMHVSYLNGLYHPGQLSHWKGEKVRTGVFKGMSGYDYIGAHLGYRFVVREAVFSSGKPLVVTLENTGFAANCDEMSLYIEAGEKDGHSRKVSEASLPAGKGVGEQKIIFPAEDMREVRGELYLRMVRSKDGHVVRLANEGAERRLRLGTVG